MTLHVMHPIHGGSAEAFNRGRLLLLVAALLMLATRLPLIVAMDVQQFSDLAWYQARALDLLRTGAYTEDGVPTAFWPVGYPAFLAGVMWLLGPHLWAGQLANLLLSLAALLLLYQWCLQRWQSPLIGGVAAVLLALYPNHMGYTPGLYSEPLFTALLLAIFVCLKPQGGWPRAVLAGVLMGCAILVKAQMLLLGPLLAALLLLPGVSWAAVQQAWRPVALCVLCAAAVLTPWVLRNVAVMGAPVIVSTNGGISLLAANNPSMTSDLRSDFNDKDPLMQAVRFTPADQVAADARARAAAWHWIGSNPGRFVALMPKKLFRFWVPDGESDWLFQAGYAGYDAHQATFRAVRIVNQVYYVALLLLCAWALPKVVNRRQPATWAFPLMLLFFSALSMVFSGQSRYHAPLMPFVIACAAFSCVRWHQRRRPA